MHANSHPHPTAGAHLEILGPGKSRYICMKQLQANNYEDGRGILNCVISVVHKYFRARPVLDLEGTNVLEFVEDFGTQVI